MPHHYSFAPIREADRHEERFFRENPDIPSYAADDDTVVFSPFQDLSPTDKDALYLNEASRVWMDRQKFQPRFNITPQQRAFFAGYGSEDDIRKTILARILSGDNSAQDHTLEQRILARQVKRGMDNA